MKKSYLALLVSGLVLISVLIWLINSNINGSEEILQIGIIFILIAFGLFVGIRRLLSEKKKLPSEDEMTKKIMTKASSISYFISIYLWLVIMYIADKKEVEIEILFGWGILGMGLILAITWIVIYFVGIKSE